MDAWVDWVANSTPFWISKAQKNLKRYLVANFAKWHYIASIFGERVCYEAPFLTLQQ